MAGNGGNDEEKGRRLIDTGRMTVRGIVVCGDPCSLITCRMANGESGESDWKQQTILVCDGLPQAAYLRAFWHELTHYGFEAHGLQHSETMADVMADIIHEFLRDNWAFVAGLYRPRQGKGKENGEQ